MDSYKKGKVDLIDFNKLISASNDNKSNWVSNAKQQIGLAISRKFKNIHEAFNQIGRT